MKAKHLFSVALCFSIVFSITSSAQQIRIAGSDTLIFLGQRFVEQYQQKHPGQFVVLGGGAAAMKSDDVDIFQSESFSPPARHVFFLWRSRRSSST